MRVRDVRGRVIHKRVRKYTRRVGKGRDDICFHRCGCWIRMLPPHHCRHAMTMLCHFRRRSLRFSCTRWRAHSSRTLAITSKNGPYPGRRQHVLGGTLGRGGCFRRQNIVLLLSLDVRIVERPLHLGLAVRVWTLPQAKYSCRLQALRASCVPRLADYTPAHLRALLTENYEHSITNYDVTAARLLLAPLPPWTDRLAVSRGAGTLQRQSRGAGDTTCRQRFLVINTDWDQLNVL